jgi:hypothetical protein
MLRPQQNSSNFFISLSFILDNRGANTRSTPLDHITHYTTLRKHFPVLSSFMTYYRFENRVTRRVQLVEQELLTLPELPSSPHVFSGVRVSRSLVFCVMFCRSLFVLLSFVYCVVCPSIYGFRLPRWYLQTRLMDNQTRLMDNQTRFMDNQTCFMDNQTQRG